MTKTGIIILEGGSIERDQVEWMTRYNKRSINPVIEKYSRVFDIRVIGTFPSLTILKHTD